MRLHRCAFVATVLAVAAPSAYSREQDYSKITCGAFLASGQANMAVIITWLRGYHAGKTGIIPFQSADPYGGRIGFYCKQHPAANLIDASEPILTDLDRGL
jgi:acid stress chaperone HdeB